MWFALWFGSPANGRGRLRLALGSGPREDSRSATTALSSSVLAPCCVVANVAAPSLYARCSRRGTDSSTNRPHKSSRPSQSATVRKSERKAALLSVRVSQDGQDCPSRRRRHRQSAAAKAWQQTLQPRTYLAARATNGCESQAALRGKGT